MTMKDRKIERYSYTEDSKFVSIAAHKCGDIEFSVFPPEVTVFNYELLVLT